LFIVIKRRACHKFLPREETEQHKTMKIQSAMKSKTIILGACTAAAMLPSVLNAQTVLFSDTLQNSVDSNWTINHSGSDFQAVFGYDYSAVGVPQDPFYTGAGTYALKFQVNQTAGVLQGVTASPTGLGFLGNYTMTFDLFCNYIFDGTGSTQVANFGVGTSGTTAVWSVNNDGLELGTILDHGSSTSYRGYLKGTSIGSTPFVGGSQSYASTYHTGLFPSVAVPPAEVALYPSQTGSSTAGTISYQWVQVSLTVSDNIVNEYINGNLIATNLDISSLTSSNIFIGLYDTSAGSANANPDLNFALFSNLTVTSVPEPTTFALAGLGLSGLFLARRRSRKSV
jgi:hypothetical protein